MTQQLQKRVSSNETAQLAIQVLERFGEHSDPHAWSFENRDIAIINLPDTGRLAISIPGETAWKLILDSRYGIPYYCDQETQIQGKTLTEYLSNLIKNNGVFRCSAGELRCKFALWHYALDQEVSELHEQIQMALVYSCVESLIGDVLSGLKEFSSDLVTPVPVPLFDAIAGLQTIQKLIGKEIGFANPVGHIEQMINREEDPWNE